jgi:VCBS repeat-containing protein
VPNFAIDVVNTAWASSDQTEKPGISDTYTVTVDGPKALMIAPGTLAITVTGNTSMTLDILSQVRHREGQSVHITDASEPAHGTVTINDDGTVTYTPDEGYVGSDSFEVTVTDEDGNSTRVRVEVEVVGQTTGMHWVYLATVLK